VNNSEGEIFVFKAFSDNLGKKLMKHLLKINKTDKIPSPLHNVGHRF
jgi:hypothetical protein